MHDNSLYSSEVQNVGVKPAVYLGRTGSEILPDTNGQRSEEALLIQKAKEFDSEAWTQIYQSHYPKIYAYLRYRLRDINLAEDIAGDVFLRAVEGIRSYKYRGSSLLAWLYRIAHNRMVDHFRHKDRLNIQPLTDEVIAESSTAQNTMEGPLVREELNSALTNITEDQRQVVLLKFFGGLNNAEVAQIIGKSEGAVKGLQHRALASLRRILEVEDRREERL